LPIKAGTFKHDALEISNRITVLRDGKKMGTTINENITKPQLATRMVGRRMCRCMNYSAGWCATKQPATIWIKYDV